jgi:hypothetical protein
MPEKRIGNPPRKAAELQPKSPATGSQWYKLPAGFAPGRSAATTATTAGASAATAASEPAAATTAGARFPGPGFVHCQGPAPQFGAVQRSHGLIRIGIHRHFDKRETARLTCIPVFHDLHSIHLSIC